MANQNFVNSKWAKVYLADVIDSMPYVKASKSYFADQMKGKKAGKSYSFVLRDSGKVTDGLSIGEGDKKSIEEREVKVTLKNKKNVVGLDILESVVDIVDFKSEIADTYGVHLGAEIQKDVIAGTLFDAATASVNANGWVAMSKAIAFLKASRVGGKVVGFMDPVAESSLSIVAMNNWHFLPSDTGAKMYADASIGKFHGCEFVYANDIPNVVGKALSIVPTGIVEKDGKISLTVASAPAIQAGTPLKVEGAYACNIVGMKTSTPFAFIVQNDVKEGDTSIQLGRVDVTECGARNCYIEGVADAQQLVGLTFTNMLEAGKTYFVAQARNTDALAFENAPLDDLIGAENSTVEVGGIKLKTTVMGNENDMENITRWDIAYGATIVDNRQNSIAYFEA